MTTKSGKHANKIAKNALDSAANNGVTKAVDMRKVAALSAGAAGVIAGAAIAFGATPAMAAEAPTSTPVNPSVPANAQDLTANKDDSKKKVDKAQQADETNQNNPTDVKKQPEQTVVKAEGKSDVNPEGTTSENQDRASNGTESQDPNKIKPNTTDKDNTKIDINETNAETMPNMYGWGSTENTFSVDGETHTVTFNFAKPKDGGTITNIAIFPAQNNGLTNEKSRKGAEYYSGNDTMHQSFSGNYKFKQNDDGSATLTMSDLFRNGNIGAAEKYAANRSIFVYVTAKDGTTTIYKTNAFRAATLVPPKTAGSVVLKYNQELTPEKVQAAITAAANSETARGDKKSVNDQLAAASASNGVFTRENGKAVRVTDTTDGKLNVKSSDAYDAKQFADINTKKTDDTNSYVAGSKTLNTYMVTDLGFKSQAIPLTVARYDTRIDKPIVEDPTNLSTEVKEEIAKKLAKINGVTPDKISFVGDEAVISFDGVDAKDAPKIKLSELVLKKFKEDQITVPVADKATVIYNPLGYSKAELARIKQSILEANKNNTDLGLTSVDQITLSYVEGDTVIGHENIGISNGQQENKITVKIKTDKAYAEFTSDVKTGKLTRLVDIRKDYDVSWDKTKIDGRDTDEGISWSDDKKTTIIYRYDPTKAEEFDTTKILGLLKATPKKGADSKDLVAGLRDLTGGEQLDHEDSNGKPRKSHMKYALKDDEPTGELSVGNMSGAYWIGNQKVSHSNEKLGDNQSISGSYSWDPEAGSVTVAGKKDKIYKARLFVQPYAMTYYKDVYLEQGRNPGNTAKAINVIFVPQTNHKTSDLQKSIGEHKTITVEGKDVPTESTYYNASDKKKDAYDEALKEAKKALELAGNTEDSKLSENLKALIDNATINLNKARAELDGAKTDKDKLSASIEANGKAAEGQNPATGTQATNQFKNVSDPDFKTADGKPDDTKNEKAKAAKKAYDEALQAAKELKDDDNATQKAVDAAKAKLDAAREKLNDFTTNKDELNAAIAADGKVNTGKNAQGTQDITKADPTYQNSTPNDRKAYDDAVAEADRVSKDPNASQKEVNEAIAALQKAKAALDAKATDKSKLAAAEKQSFDNPSTDASKQSVFYKNALNKQTNGTSENEKQAAKNAIDNYNNALTNARTILNNEKATQAQVDEAKKKLEEAENALHENYKSDDNDLTKAIANNVSGYLMPAYFNAFDQAQKDGADSQAAKDFKAYNDAYQKAKELSKKLKETEESKKPKQTEIDAAKTALEDARKVIDKYATDTSKISAALLHSLAITNSPAYKNASAGAEGSDEAKAKAAYDAAFKELQKAFNDQMDKDKGDDGNEISESVIPDKNIDMTNKDALKKLQAHAKGQPLNRDVTKLLAKLNDAVKGLDKFKTKTDELLKSVNEDATTHPSPAFKNASERVFQKADGSGADDDKNAKAKQAYDKYGETLNIAKELLNNPSATQAQVDAAKKNLDDARKELDKYKTDTSKLKASVKEHGSTDGPATIEGTVTSDAYRNASDPHFMKADATDPTKLVEDTTKNEAAKKAKADYDKALVEAQDLLNKADPKNNTPLDAQPTQQQINDALKKLDEKRQALEAYKTVTTALETEANKSTAEHAAVTEGDFEYTPEFKNAQAKTSNGVENADVTAYKEALKKARDLAKAANPTDPDAKNSSHPTQQQINEALEALKNAKKQITDNYKTNLEPLTSAKDFADGDFKKTPEYKNALAKKTAGDQGATQALGTDGGNTGFDNVLNQIKQKLGDNDWKQKATQKQVNALLKQLQDAQDKIAKYKTDAIKLEREVGDKDQDGRPVTPPFEVSVPYKNALAKADAEENKTDPNSATVKLKAYADKLAEAQKIIDQVNKPDPNAAADSKPTQAQVDQALTDLQNAKKAIDDAFKTNASALKNEADDKDEHGNVKQEADKFENSTEYKNASAKTDADGKKDVQTYKDALKKANELLELFGDDGNPKTDIPAGKQIPTQQEVDEAQKALKEIKDKILANYKTNPHDLQDEFDKSKDGKDDTRDGLFEDTPEFKNADAKKGDEDAKKALDAYTEKLKAAKALLDKFDRTTGELKQGETAPTQKELDDALDALQAAKKKITDGYKTDPSELKKEADKDGDFAKTPEFQNAVGSTEADAYKKALEEANKVLGDKDATQAQVDDALKKLKQAKDDLVSKHKTDKNKLYQETGNDPEFRKSIPFLIADNKDIAEYNKALNEANAVLADPNATQAQVDEALRKLQAIKQRILDFYNSLGSGSDDDSDGNNNGNNGADNANNANAANAVDKSMLHAEVNGALADIANGAGAAGAANGAKGTKGALVDASVMKEFNDALENARRVLADPNATQEQVEAATMRLRAARAALNAAKANKGSNSRGNMGVQTGVDSATLSAFAAVFVGLAGLGVSAKRRKHAR